MSELLIISIVLIGVLLVVVEIFFIPGTTIFGIIGGLVMVAGVYLAYQHISTDFGHMVLGGACLAAVGLTIAGFKAVQSDHFSLTEVNKGKVNLLDEYGLSIGEKGLTIGILRPSGKARFGDKKVEVFSQGDYIEVGVEIEIFKMTNDRIYVKPVLKATDNA